MPKTVRLTPFDVPVPRPVSDEAFRSNVLLSGIFLTVGTVLAGVITSQFVRHSQAFLHESVQTVAHVESVRFYNSKGARAYIRSTYPTASGTMLVFDQTSEQKGMEAESTGSMAVWYLPREPAVHQLTPPSEQRVWVAQVTRLVLFGALGATGVLGFVVSKWRRDQERADLRDGDAFRGRVVECGVTLEFVYGPDDRRGSISLWRNDRVSDWPVGREITVLQRKGAPPAIWERFTRVELVAPAPRSALESPPG